MRPVNREGKSALDHAPRGEVRVILKAAFQQTPKTVAKPH